MARRTRMVALQAAQFQDGAQNVQQLRDEVEPTTNPAAALAQQQMVALQAAQFQQHLSTDTALHIVLSGTAAPKESKVEIPAPAKGWLRPHGRPPDHAAHSGCELPECSLRCPIER
jgi:hypothetical protein